MKRLAPLLAAAGLLLGLALHGEWARGQVLFETDFETGPNWTVTQPTTGGLNCLSNCSIPNGFQMYRNGTSFCAPLGVPGAPGNNNFYINTGAGYPGTTTACHSGTRCLTHWAESCNYSEFDDSDADLGNDLGQEHDELYLRQYIKFAPNYRRGQNGWQFKLYHIQAYPGGGVSPWSYFGQSQTNQPVSSGGIAEYDGYLFYYATIRCQQNYYCNPDVLWPLSSVAAAYQPGGIFDGGWHSLELRAKTNTVIGTADALLEVWKDGTKLAYAPGYEGDALQANDAGSTQRRGWRFFSVLGNSNNDFTMSPTSMPDAEQQYALDDVVLSTTYVGAAYLPGSSGPTAGLTGQAATAALGTVAAAGQRNETSALAGSSVTTALGALAASGARSATVSLAGIPAAANLGALSAKLSSQRSMTRGGSRFLRWGGSRNVRH